MAKMRQKYYFRIREKEIIATLERYESMNLSFLHVEWYLSDSKGLFSLKTSNCYALC